MLTEEHFQAVQTVQDKGHGGQAARDGGGRVVPSVPPSRRRWRCSSTREAAARRSAKVAKLVEDALLILGMRRTSSICARPDARQESVSTASPDASGSARARSSWSSRKPAAARAVVQGSATRACRRLIPVRYTRLADICDDLNRARAAGTAATSKMDAYKSVALLLVDDFMTTPISTQNSVDLFRDHGGARGPPRDCHRLAARAERVVPAHRGAS